MATMGSNFLPFVERGHLWFSQDVELLFCAQHALVGDGVEWGAPVDHLPGDGVGGAAGFELPYVGAQDGLYLSFQVVAQTPTYVSTFSRLSTVVSITVAW